MVLADLGRKITKALHSLSKATIINEEVSDLIPLNSMNFKTFTMKINLGAECHAERDLHGPSRS